jgi:hypothetical protein
MAQGMIGGRATSTLIVGSEDQKSFVEGHAALCGAAAARL